MLSIQILLVEPEPQRQRALLQAFKDADLSCKSLSDAGKLGAALRAVKPELLVLRAEPGSPVLEAALGEPAHAELPIALLSTDLRQAEFAERMRTGVVSQWDEPSAQGAVSRARALLDTRMHRTGIATGQGTGADLRALMHHLQITRRSATTTSAGRSRRRAPAPRPISPRRSSWSSWWARSARCWSRGARCSASWAGTPPPSH